MRLNTWRCETPGCERTAFGAGSVIGLLAIGWHVVISIGVIVRCPEHFPPASRCTRGHVPKEDERPCSLCASADGARFWQSHIDPTYKPRS